MTCCAGFGETGVLLRSVLHCSLGAEFSASGCQGSLGRALVGADQFAGVEDMAGHRRDQALVVEIGLGLQRLVEGIDAEMVVMDTMAARRCRAVVADGP